MTIQTQQAQEMTTADDTLQFDSEAWLLVGWTRSLAGWLAFQDGCIAFADETGEVLFNTRVAEIEEVWSPWYYFGGGLKLRIAGETFRLSFVRPNDQPGGVTRPPTWGTDLEKAARVSEFVGENFTDIVSGRKRTSVWLALLGAAAARDTL